MPTGPADSNPGEPRPLAGLVRDRYGLSPRAFARLANLPESTLAEWERLDPVDIDALGPIRELDRLYEALARVVAPSAIPPWLARPNPAFEGRTPLDLIERGQADRLWRMIALMESGVPS